MHKQEPVPENETHKILFVIQTDHRILARRPDLELINKEKILLSSRFHSSSGPENGNEKTQKDKQILRSCQRAEKSVEHEGNNDNTNTEF